MAHNLTSVFAFEYCFLFQWLLLALTFSPEHNRWQWPREREKDGKTELKKMQAKTHNVKIFQNGDTVHTHKFSLYRKEKLFHRVHKNRSRICIIRQSNCSAFDRESLYLCIFFDVVPFHSIPFIVSIRVYHCVTVASAWNLIGRLVGGDSVALVRTIVFNVHEMKMYAKSVCIRCDVCLMDVVINRLPSTRPPAHTIFIQLPFIALLLLAQSHFIFILSFYCWCFFFRFSVFRCFFWTVFRLLVHPCSSPFVRLFSFHSTFLHFLNKNESIVLFFVLFSFWFACFSPPSCSSVRSNLLCNSLLCFEFFALRHCTCSLEIVAVVVIVAMLEYVCVRAREFSRTFSIVQHILPAFCILYLLMKKTGSSLYVYTRLCAVNKWTRGTVWLSTSFEHVWIASCIFFNYTLSYCETQ